MDYEQFKENFEQDVRDILEQTGGHSYHHGPWRYSDHNGHLRRGYRRKKLEVISNMENKIFIM